MIDEDRLDATATPSPSHGLLADVAHRSGGFFEVALANEDGDVTTGARLLVAVEVADQVRVGEARADKQAERILKALGDIALLPRGTTLHPVVVLLGQDDALRRAVATGIPVQMGHRDGLLGRRRAAADVGLDVSLGVSPRQQRPFDQVVVVGREDREAIAEALPEVRHLMGDGTRLKRARAVGLEQLLGQQLDQVVVGHDLDERAGGEEVVLLERAVDPLRAQLVGRQERMVVGHPPQQSLEKPAPTRGSASIDAPAPTISVV